MGPFRESKRDRQESAQALAEKTARRQYDMSPLEVSEAKHKIRAGQSHFLQRFGKLRIHRVPYEYGVLDAYCAYDKSLGSIAFFLPVSVGEFIRENLKTKKQVREERKAKEAEAKEGAPKKHTPMVEQLIEELETITHDPTAEIEIRLLAAKQIDELETTGEISGEVASLPPKKAPPKQLALPPAEFSPPLFPPQGVPPAPYSTTSAQGNSSDRDEIALRQQIQFVSRQINNFVRTHNMMYSVNQEALTNLKRRYASLCTSMAKLVDSQSPSRRDHIFFQ